MPTPSGGNGKDKFDADDEDDDEEEAFEEDDGVWPLVNRRFIVFDGDEFDKEEFGDEVDVDWELLPSVELLLLLLFVIW